MYLQYDICDKFPDNFQGRPGPGPWFNTVGSNYGCSSATCCLWFPPTKCADIPLVRYRFLPFFDERGSDDRAATGLEHFNCNDQPAVEDNAITAAEINQGQVCSAYNKHPSLLQRYFVCYNEYL